MQSIQRSIPHLRAVPETAVIVRASGTSVITPVLYHRILIAAVAAAVLVAVALSYASTRRVPAIDAIVTLAAAPGGSVANDKPDRIAGLLKSPEARTLALQRLGAAASQGAAAAVDETRLIDQAQDVQAIQDRLSVTSISGTRLYRVHVSGQTAGNDLATVNALLAAAARHGDPSVTPAALQNNIAAVRARTVDVDAELANARATLATMRANNTEAAVPQGGAAPAAGDATSASPNIPSDSDGQALDAMVAARADLVSKHADMAQHYGPRYPGMVAIEAQLAALEPKIELATKQHQEAIAKTARAAAKAAAAARSVREGQAKDEQAQSAQLKLLEAQSDKVHLDLALLEQKLVTATSDQARPLAIVEAPHAAPPVRRASWPYALGGVIAAICGAILAWLVAEQLQKGFRTETDVAFSLGLPLAGLIPALTHETGVLPRNPADLVVTEPESPFSRSIAELADTLGLRKRRRPGSSLAICSAVSGDGKTTVSIALARTLGLAGLRCVLIDCDPRRRQVSEMLAPGAAAGLIQVLHHEATLEQVLVTDAASGAFVIPHSSQDAVDSGLFAAKHVFEDLFVALKRDFDVIILDTPPVLALAEARMYAAVCDRSLLVARWRGTSRRIAREALQLLAEGGSRTDAALLTFVQTAS
jgi:Mrp family chromosome partitioning ATPase